MLKKLLLPLLLMPLVCAAQKRVTIIPTAGYGWRVNKTSSELNQQEREYFKNLKSGFNFGVSAYYQINDQMGLGVKYDFYTASSTGYLAHASRNVMITTNDKITFIGPAFLYSNFEEESKHKLYYDMSLGLMSYTSKANSATVKGSNMGLAGSFAYMYAITPAIYVGPQFSYTAGVLKSINVNGQQKTLEKGQYEGLHRISLSAGVTIRL